MGTAAPSLRHVDSHAVADSVHMPVARWVQIDAHEAPEEVPPPPPVGPQCALSASATSNA